MGKMKFILASVLSALSVPVDDFLAAEQGFGFHGWVGGSNEEAVVTQGWSFYSSGNVGSNAEVPSYGNTWGWVGGSNTQSDQWSLLMDFQSGSNEEGTQGAFAHFGYSGGSNIEGKTLQTYGAFGGFNGGSNAQEMQGSLIMGGTWNSGSNAQVETKVEQATG